MACLEDTVLAVLPPPTTFPPAAQVLLSFHRHSSVPNFFTDDPHLAQGLSFYACATSSSYCSCHPNKPPSKATTSFVQQKKQHKRGSKGTSFGVYYHPSSLECQPKRSAHYHRLEDIVLAVLPPPTTFPPAAQVLLSFPRHSSVPNFFTDDPLAQGLSFYACGHLIILLFMSPEQATEQGNHIFPAAEEAT